MFAVGDAGGPIFMMIEGLVELLRRDGNVVAIVRPGGLPGRLALIDDRPRSVTAFARAAVRVAPIGPLRLRSVNVEARRPLVPD